MKKHNTFSLITLILGIVSLLWLFYDLYEITHNLEKVLDVNELGYIIGIGYIFILLFHVFAIIYMLQQLRSYKEINWIRIIVMIFGVFSLFAIAGEKVMYDEITREITFGGAGGEIFILSCAIVLNILFTFTMLVLIIKTFAVTYRDTENMDEIIFTVAHYMGIASGIVGLLLTLSLEHRKVEAHRVYVYVPFYLLFLIPYGLSVSYWLSFKLKEKISNWYDEKQLRDLMKSALATLILSIPAMLIPMSFERAVAFYFFPYYFFLILLLFSTGTLYFFRQK